MSGYRTHLRAGVVAHAVLIGGAVLALLLGAPRSILVATGTALPFTLVGALAPDVDHPDSKSYLFVIRAVPVLVALAAGTILYHFRSVLRTLAAVLPVTVAPKFVAGWLHLAVALAVWRATVVMLAALRPTHRTVTHRVPTWIVIGTVLTGGLVYVYVGLRLRSPMFTAFVHAGALVTGAISHLYCDGLLSERTTYTLSE